MKMVQSILSVFLIHYMVAIVDATSVKMDFLPAAHARVDPIISQDCPSDHVHTFYGPISGVDPRRKEGDGILGIWKDLKASQVNTNTGNVEENKSMYWHPTVYKYNPAANSYTRDVIAQTSTYYIWETGATTAFPDGFRMIGGFDSSKSFANAECVDPQPCMDGDCYSENDFFPTDRCDELEVSMRLPNCWDGINLGDLPPHTNHVAYAEDSRFDGDCPESHPVKLPQIQFFFRIFEYNGGWHTFSDMSSIFHADYVSGWDSTFLQEVLNKCSNEGEAAMPNFFCENHLTYRDAPKCTDENECDFSDPKLLQKLKSIQPTIPLDVQGTIVNEETETIIGELPRGECNGALVSNNNENDDNIIPTTPSTKSCVNSKNVVFKNIKGKKKKCPWVKNGSLDQVKKKCNKSHKGVKVKKNCARACGVYGGVGPCRFLFER